MTMFHGATVAQGMRHRQQPCLFLGRIRPLCLGLLLCPLLKELRLKLGRANEVFHLQAIEHMVDDVLLLFALGDGHSSDVF